MKKPIRTCRRNSATPRPTGNILLDYRRQQVASEELLARFHTQAPDVQEHHRQAVLNRSSVYLPKGSILEKMAALAWEQATHGKA